MCFQQCQTVTEQDCQDTYEEKCTDTVGEECETLIEQVCNKGYVYVNTIFSRLIFLFDKNNITIKFQLCEQTFDTECETVEEEECRTEYEEVCEPVYKVN